jgi:C4-type Zn-finger protein
MFLVYGSKKANICLDEFMMYCPACEADTFADVWVTSTYYHIFFIPVFPYEKEMNCACQKCGLKRYNMPFAKEKIKNIVEIKNKFRHPLFTYSLSFLVLLLVALVIIVAPKS